MDIRAQLRFDISALSVEALLHLPHARALLKDEALPLLVSPDSKALLREEGDALTDGEHRYPYKGDTLLLLPERLHAYFTDRLHVPLSYEHDAFMQYFLLSSIKQHGEINAPSDNVHYQRHLHRMKEACAGTQGIVLDVGCDDPRIGAGLLPPEACYIGLDPFCIRSSPFRLIGVGEALPIRDHALDGVMFNTSLDHILDWHAAIDEAWRVLKQGGHLLLSSLVWTERAELLRDSVHFHHFREYELLGGLERFDILRLERFDYKGDTQRHGLYITARKR